MRRQSEMLLWQAKLECLGKTREIRFGPGDLNGRALVWWEQESWLVNVARELYRSHSDDVCRVHRRCLVIRTSLGIRPDLEGTTRKVILLSTPLAWNHARVWATARPWRSGTGIFSGLHRIADLLDQPGLPGHLALSGTPLLASVEATRRSLPVDCLDDRRVRLALWALFFLEAIADSPATP